MLLRWGICGCGHVSGDFARAVSLLPASNHKIVAAGASSLERASDFIEKHGIAGAKPHKSYADLFGDPQVDVIYAGVLNHMHKDVVVSALNAGKHVLCEKPLGLNRKQIQEMVGAAKKAGKFLMEGYWTVFFPVFRQIDEAIQAGIIGPPKVIYANFGYTMHDEQKYVREFGGGCLMATGVYLPMLALHIFKEKPELISVTGVQRGNSGVDDNACINMRFSGNRVAQMMYSGSHNLPNTFTVIGGKEGDSRETCRLITIKENFWCPTKVEIDGEVHRHPLPEGSAHFQWKYPNSSGFAYEAEAVRQSIANKQTECPLMTWEKSLAIAEINDEIRRQLGVVFPQD